MLIGSKEKNKMAWIIETLKKQKQEYICVGKYEKWKRCKAVK